MCVIIQILKYTQIKAPTIIPIECVIIYLNAIWKPPLQYDTYRLADVHVVVRDEVCHLVCLGNDLSAMVIQTVRANTGHGII